VNAVAPGYIASSGMDHYPPEAGPMLREMRETVPLGRFRQRGRDVRGHRVPAEPGGQLHQRHRAAHGWRAAAGAHGLGPGGAPEDVQQRDAVKPFDGFHRYQTPKVFQK
jgi:citronellol/citronellal dehydrogenase